MASIFAQRDNEATKPTESQPRRPTHKSLLTVRLSKMSHHVLKQNQTISTMTDQVNVQPNTLPNLGTCRFCGAGLRHTFVDLGMSPPCEAILERAQLNEMEAFYPLHVFICDQCFLVQLQEYVAPKAKSWNWAAMTVICFSILQRLVFQS